ncbi:hypothetical protein, partial [Klebsiella pneumoniae]|uniref:hypothetical protein n=1 Tax=Klebsiella pneumoniae TaxID=573 RepID=UPI002731BB5D
MRARREAMMAEREAGEQNQDPRERMRQRMLERSRWWEQDELKESLTLSEAQAEALTAHQERLDAERQSFR